MPHVGDYQLLKSGGQYNGNLASYNVYLYANTSSEESITKSKIANELEYTAEQLVDWGSVSYYDIYYSNDYPNLDHGSRDDYWDAFGNWLDNNGYSANTGCHLAISSNFGGGYADLPRIQGGSSFVDSSKSVMGTGKTDIYTRMGAIMETLHTFIRHDYNEVTEMIRNENAVHDFGTIIDLPGDSGLDRPVTPLATGYTGWNSAATNGECGNGYWLHDSHTSELTSCTKEAVKITANRDSDQ